MERKGTALQAWESACANEWKLECSVRAAAGRPACLELMCTSPFAEPLCFPPLTKGRNTFLRVQFPKVTVGKHSTQALGELMI